MNAKPDGRFPFPETTIGKIIIGVAIAAGGALISYFVAAYTLSVTPPVAEVSPTEIDVPAGELVEFSAAGSRDPDGGKLEFAWSLGGVPLERSPVGACRTRDNRSVVACRFATPGTFAVGVTAIGDSGLSANAAASVTVQVAGGYIGFLLLGADADAAYRELLYGVDWIALQGTVSRPIVLYDPDSDAPVYAASFVGLEEHRTVSRPTGALAGVKLVVPGLPLQARTEFEIALMKLGATLMPMPAAEVYMAVTRGVADGGAFIIDSPADLTRIAEEIGANK